MPFFLVYTWCHFFLCHFFLVPFFPVPFFPVPFFRCHFFRLPFQPSPSCSDPQGKKIYCLVSEMKKIVCWERKTIAPPPVNRMIHPLEPSGSDSVLIAHLQCDSVAAGEKPVLKNARCFATKSLRKRRFVNKSGCFINGFIAALI